MNFSFKYDEKKYTVADFTKNYNEYILNLGNSVKVIAREQEYPDFDAREWVLWFENDGSDNSCIFSNINDCDMEITLKNPENEKVGYITRGGFPSVTSMRGPVDPEYYKKNDEVSAQEFGLFTEFISGGETRSYKNKDARSSDGTIPVFGISSGGAGAVIGIGWTGGWRADFVRDGDKVQIITGLKKAEFYLKPGEKLRTSSTVVMEYDGEDKYNKFRRLVKRYFSHKTNFPEKAEGLFAAEMWGALPSDKMIERIKEYTDHGIRFDQIWIDAMWATDSEKPEDHKNVWGKYNGNWTVNTRIHPNKLADVRDTVRDAGSGMMLWCEPEYVQFDNAPVLLEHPDWFLDNKLLYYGNDEALQYVIDLISEMIEHMDLVCYRQDFCYGPAEIFSNYDEADRKGVTEIKHIMGMYRLWDTLLQKYPHIIIDNCASGGRRIDMETLKRSIPFFRSDYLCVYNEKAEVLQVHNSGISKYFPFNGCTTRMSNDIYAIRSSYSSSWGYVGYGAIFLNMNEEGFECLKKCVDEYRHIRKYFVCDFYNHGSSVWDDTAWTIWQYHNPREQKGIVMAFRRCESPHSSAEIALSGMTDGEYIFKNFNDNCTFNGNSRLKITLPEKRSSVIYEYKLK